MGDDVPAWARWLTYLSLYLLAAGGAMAWYAWSLEPPPVPGELLTLEGLEHLVDPPPGPTPIQRHYGVFGGLTLACGIMGLVLAVLARFFNLLPTIITMSVLLGCMALVVVLSLMSGLEGDLRDKILNQKAHIRVSRSDGRHFQDYEVLADALADGVGVAGASPYLEGEIMIRSGLNRQGAVLTGIRTERQTTVSNLREIVKEGDYRYLDHPEEIPDPDPFAFADEQTPYRLRHLEKERRKHAAFRPGPAQDDDDAADGAPWGTDAPPEGAESTPAGKAARLPSLRDTKLPKFAIDPDDDAIGSGADDGWEDPSAVLGQGPEDPDGEDELVEIDVRRGVLDSLPIPPGLQRRDLDDGWEDPSTEIPRLRDEGVLPPGVDEVDPAEVADPARPQEDDLEDEGADGDPVLIGRELALELSVHVGSSIQLITPVGRITPAGELPGFLKGKVAGVFFSGMYEYDRKNVYAPLPVVQRFLLTGDRVSGIEVKLVDVESIDAGKAEVERIVEEIGRSEELMVEDWRDLNRNLFSAMFLEKVAMFIALLFVVLVASFGILASNLMSVMEKSKEIAILKAMGTTDGGIMRVFIAEGLCVGVLGSFGGIAMGLTLCWALDRFGLPLNENVYYIEKLPVVIDPAEVALVGGAALVIVCFSSLYPALVASRLRPVDALRQGDA
jgi:ABC-type lipoprotein release transport system permease subunit